MSLIHKIDEKEAKSIIGGVDFATKSECDQARQDIGWSLAHGQCTRNKNSGRWDYNKV